MEGNTLKEFRVQTREWIEANCPESMRTRQAPEEAVNGGSKRRSTNPDAYLWLERMAERGWTAPTWPTEYGGGGLDMDHYLVLLEELQRVGARPPLGGMGITMLGPTLLELGSQAQKLEHLPRITSGEVAWCQGYSEPGAGSDLASLATFAQDCGDHFLVNGSKIWTSGGMYADWMFCLVRTDKDAPKHQGISFLLLSMDDPGVTIKPIQMINGASPFCQTFFDNVRVPKENLVGTLNEGWGIGKRLLQHERSGLAALAAADQVGPLQRIKPTLSLPKLAEHYAANDPAIRDETVRSQMMLDAFMLTQKRTVEATDAGQTPGAETSIFKYVEAEYVKAQLELQLKIRGTSGLGWEGDTFTDEEIGMCKLWLEAKSISIAGGSNEVQLNIIAKRVLGLPD